MIYSYSIIMKLVCKYINNLTVTGDLGCDVLTCTAVVGITDVCVHFVVSQSCVIGEWSICPTFLYQCTECHLGFACVKQNRFILSFDLSISLGEHFVFHHNTKIQNRIRATVKKKKKCSSEFFTSLTLILTSNSKF